MKKSITIILAFFYLQLNAQTITNYTTADGLISDVINCVEIADGTNEVWIGTNSGVSHFDGLSWTSYTTADGLVDNNINTIVEASGDIWVGTDFGVSKFDGSTWTTYTSTDGLALDKVVHIAQSPIQELWFSHSSFSAGVTVTTPGTNALTVSNCYYYGYPDLPISGICATTFDDTPNGGVWLASPLDGVIHFDGTVFTQYTSNSHGLINNFSSSIVVENPYALIGTNGGLSVIDFGGGNTVTNYTQMYLLPPPDTLNEVQDIILDTNGGVWVAVYVGYLNVGGVAYYNGSQWQNFDVSDGLAGSYVRSITVDENNDIWAGTTTGLSKISGITSNIYNLPFNDKINIFPNPTNGILTIQLETNQIESIKLFNLFGNTVFKESGLCSSVRNIDMSHLAKGIYVAEIKTEKNVYLQKILLQ